MGKRDAEIGGRDTTRFHRSIEWRAHFQFAECLSAPDALGFQSYHKVDPRSNSRTLEGRALSRPLFVGRHGGRPSIILSSGCVPRKSQFQPAPVSRLLQLRPRNPESCPSTAAKDRHGTRFEANREARATARNIFATLWFR